MMRRIVTALFEMVVLVIVYDLLWHGLAWLTLILSKSIDLTAPGVINVAVIIGFLFGFIFTILIEEIAHNENLHRFKRVSSLQKQINSLEAELSSIKSETKSSKK